MVDRPHKPSALASTPGLAPQAQVAITHDNSRVTAVLPTGESVEVLLHGATVVSWKDRHGAEKLWLSDAARLDGSKAVRGGIPLVFPVFGTAPDHAATAKLPQHGFARTSRWEFLGKSTSESSAGAGPSGGASSSASRAAAAADTSVKLDFGLGSAELDEKTRGLWGHAFGLLYSVTLDRGSLTTSIAVTNEDDRPWDFQVLFHTYLRVKDISKVEVGGLDKAPYADKVDGAKATKSQSGAITIAGEVDRVYSPGIPWAPEKTLAVPAVTVLESGRQTFGVVRDGLGDVVVWNPGPDKAQAHADFEPKDGFRHMLCIEAGSVKGWQTLEPGDAFQAAQTIFAS